MKNKQNVSNTSVDNNSHTKPDVKRPQMTSNDLKLISNESAKIRKNKLKGGDPSDSDNGGKNLIEQAFSSN